MRREDKRKKEMKQSLLHSTTPRIQEIMLETHAVLCESKIDRKAIAVLSVYGSCRAYFIHVLRLYKSAHPALEALFLSN